jgi:putative solute:sodium symporter small subunit
LLNQSIAEDNEVFWGNSQKSLINSWKTAWFLQLAISSFIPGTLFYILIHKPMPSQPEKMKAYWRKNLQTLLILLLIWFIVSFGFGILLVEQLNEFRLGGYKLGFWFAQQGSIYAFVILIFVYVVRMNKLDKEFDVNED